MARDFDTNIGGADPSTDTPESKWTAWAIWSAVSLLVVLFIVFVGGFDAGLLLGWAGGIIIAAMLVVFRR